MNDEDIAWYHGDLTRQEAEDLLTNNNTPDGSFLVRNSNSSAGDFVLSVLHSDEVSHYQIRRHAEDSFFSIFENATFHGLESLIEHYSTTDGALFPNFKLTSHIAGESPPCNAQRHGHTNLLHRATVNGNYKIVSELLKAGYKHEAKNQHGQTAVHLASMKGEDEILQKLIDHGGSVNSRDTAGFTPLHYACQNNFPSTVRLLVQVGGANVQARNTESGSVPLHEAAGRGHQEVVRELLSLNAPSRPRNRDKLLPFQLAKMNGFVECAEILENYQCPTPKTNRTQWYHGTLSRQEAETRIKNYSEEDGTFLVRWSERNKRNVLTMLYDNTCYNFIVCKQGEYMYIDDGPFMESLEHVIDYYSYISDGLPTILVKPTPPPPKPPVPEFSTIPRPRKIKKPEISLTPERPRSKSIEDQFQNITFTFSTTDVSASDVSGKVDESNRKDDGYVPMSNLNQLLNDQQTLD